MSNYQNAVFSQIDRNDFSSSDQSLITEIESYFHICQLNEGKPHADFSKPYMVFAYNLFELGCPDVAMEMIAHIKDNYFSTRLLADMRSAENYWQQAETLKNQVNKDDRVQYKQCRQEAEYFIIAWGVIARLSQMETFPQMEDFRKFLGMLQNETFQVRVMPKIGLVKNN